MAASPVNIYGDIVNDVLNIARARVVDSILTPDGYPGGAGPGRQFTPTGGGPNLSTGQNADGSPILRTQVIFNAGWRKMQKYLQNLGYRELIGDNLIIPSLPINNNPDPVIQSWLSWNGFFDGTVLHALPALPQDFSAPLKIRERLSGQNAVFTPMRVALDGIRAIYVPRSCFNQVWEFRNNAIYVPGATALTDLQIRYTKRLLPDFPDPNYYIANTPWYQQRIPIPGCASALAWYVAYEACFPGEEQTDAAQAILAQAQGEADLIFNDQARADQRTNNRRKPRGYSSRSMDRGY